MAEHGALYNEDLAPVPAEKRTWNLWHFASLWVGMSVCIPTYTLASGLIDQGMSWSQAISTILLGNCIVLVPMILNAHAGTRYGIPFPVFARASFGVLGANVPALLRAFVACGWFGIQTWYGGDAIFKLAVVFAPGLKGLAPLGFVGINAAQVASFLLFWLINVYFIWKGTESIKWMETLAAPFLIVVGLALLLWAWAKAGSMGEILAKPGLSGGAFWLVFFPSLTAMVGFWATLSLNIPDFTRYARSQRDQALGQAIGLPTTMTLFAFIGVAVTSATPLIFNGATIWNPVDLLGRIGGPLVVLFSMFALSIATLSTNIAANVVSPANDISNVYPKAISFKMGGYITAVIGILMMPWKLLETSSDYIFTWLIGYSALLGPIGGVMIADYFVLRKAALNADGLYRRGGAYEYANGFNWRALVALALGVAPCVPGFFNQLSAIALKKAGQPVPAAGAFDTIYTYAWFVGFLVAGAVYLALSYATAPKAAQTEAAPAKGG
jgi:NCS1 family nucleobase:cation symporter-1